MTHRTQCPWPFTGTSDPTATATLNLPTPEGAEFGSHIARFVDIEVAKMADPPERCDDCAARLGTVPNQCASTLMDLMKCAMERVPFYCHKPGALKLCAGYVALVAKRETATDG